MLTVDDIRNVGFRKAKFGGYKPEDVDAFIDDVQISFEKMIFEMNKLREANRGLSEQVRKFKEEDRSIENVISSAKEAAEKSLDDARIHTSDMISDATKRSKEIMDKAKKEVEINREISERLKSESAKLREKLDDIYKRHLKIIAEIPSDVFEENSENGSDIMDKKCDNSGHHAEDNKDNCVRVDISKAAAPSIKKRFFEIDAKVSKGIGGGANAQGQRGKVFLDEDIFSSDDIKKAKDKFKKLQIGENFGANGEEEKVSSGAYSGIFKNMDN